MIKNKIAKVIKFMNEEGKEHKWRQTNDVNSHQLWLQMSMAMTLSRETGCE